MTGQENGRALNRASGCLAGQFCGDAFGAQYEFRTSNQIRRIMEIVGSETMEESSVWSTLPGQITDDSEMALALTHSIISSGGYYKENAKNNYIDWMNSRPFDIGGTTATGLRGRLNHQSQANGAMMRISPLAVYLSKFGYSENEDWEKADTLVAADTLITHPNPICIHANILFVRALIKIISSETPPGELYQKIKEWSVEIGADQSLLSVIESAKNVPPADYTENQGWVLIAFWNALYQLLHAESPEQGIINTVKSGGDTDTNAAIAGALIGAYFGYDSFPNKWLDTVQNIKPGGKRPRPEMYWVGNIKDLTEKIFNIKVTG